MFATHLSNYTFFHKFPRLPYITLTNSITKITTIPEDRTLYDFCFRICNTIPVTFVIYSKCIITQVCFRERGFCYRIRISMGRLAYPKSVMFFTVCLAWADNMGKQNNTKERYIYHSLNLLSI